VGPASGAAIWGRVSIGVEARMRDQAPLRTIIVYAGGQMALMPREDS
jgi:hypothetical protein